MKRIILTLLFCNIFFNFIIGQDTKNNIVNVLTDEFSQQIEFRLPTFEIKDTNFRQEYKIDEEFNYIRIDDEFGIIDSVGLPQLPQLTFDLHIPYDAVDITIKIVSETKHKIPVSRRIMPTQEDVNKEKPVFDFQINDKYYNSSGGFYNLSVQLTEDFIVFGEHGISLTVFPFMYNPQENSLTVLTNAIFAVSYTCTGKTSEPYFSEAKESYLTGVFKNYNVLKNHQKSGGNPILGRYLMITPPEYENTLTYFANYKRNIGFDVEVVTVTAGSSVATVKSIIQNRYNNTSTRPDYVLLVGDVDKIPAYEGDLSGDYDDPLTDLGYSLLEGNDIFVDVFLGRFSVSNSEDLKNIINKTIFMEMNMHRFNKKAVLLAGGGDGANEFVKPHNIVKNDILIPKGFQCDYSYATQGATHQDGINALNGDYLFFIYRGHGDKYCIQGPFGLCKSDISTSTNPIYPMGFGFACLTNIFGYSECFGESWIRSPQGGICYFGATTTTYRHTNNVIEEKVFEKMYSLNHLSPCINSGMKKFYQNLMNNLRKKHVKSYNLLGDPSFNLSGIGCKESFTFYYPEVFISGAEVTYRANDFIENNNSFVIESGADVKLLAGNVVRLKPGFHAKAGSNVNIQIIPCNDGMIRKSLAGDDNDEIDDVTENVVEQKKEEIINPALFNVFPNPTTDDFSLAYTLDSNSFVQIDLYDMQGGFIKNFLKLSQQEAGVYYHNFSLSGLPTGMYLLVFKNTSKTITNKIIKQ